MKLEIHDCQPAEEEPVRLKLLPRSGVRGVKLCIVNKDGTVKGDGILLTISSTGQVKLLNSVGRYGFHWADQGRKAPPS